MVGGTHAKPDAQQRGIELHVGDVVALLLAIDDQACGAVGELVEQDLGAGRNLADCRQRPDAATTLKGLNG